MKTITAKEFRLNLDKILDQVLAGEEVLLKHRFKQAVRLTTAATHKTLQAKGAFAGLQAFDAAAKKPSPFSPNKSIKQLYKQTISKKYGIK